MEHFKQMGWVFGEQGDIYVCELCGDTYTSSSKSSTKNITNTKQ